MSWRHVTYAPVVPGVPKLIFVMLAVVAVIAVLAGTSRWVERVLRRLVRQRFCLPICQPKECDDDQDTHHGQAAFCRRPVSEHPSILPGHPRPENGQAQYQLGGCADERTGHVRTEGSFHAGVRPAKASGREESLQRIFHVEDVPCDTRLREILDPVNPEHLRSAFGNVFT